MTIQLAHILCFIIPHRLNPMATEASSNEQAPGDPSQLLAPQSVSTLVVSSNSAATSDGQLHLEQELERLKQENVEVKQLREDRQRLLQLQAEAQALQTKNTFLEDLNCELEGSNSALKEEALSLQKSNQDLQASNTQLKQDITHLDIKIAHLKYLREENENLRTAEQKRNDNRETQLQHAINLKVDLMNASTHIDSILQGFSRHDDTSSSATDTGVEAETDSKDKPPVVTPTGLPSPVSPFKEPLASPFVPQSTEVSLRNRLPPFGQLDSPAPARSELRIRSTAPPTPLQNRITPALIPDHRSSSGRGDKRNRDAYSPRNAHGYDSASDGEYSYSRPHLSRRAPRRRSADRWP